MSTKITKHGYQNIVFFIDDSFDRLLLVSTINAGFLWRIVVLYLQFFVGENTAQIARSLSKPIFGDPYDMPGMGS